MNNREYYIHTTDASQVNYEPLTELNEELGMVAFSLWYREDDFEFPILHQSRQPAWLSADVDYHRNSEAQELTDSFIEGVAQLTNDDSGGGWGGVDEAVWDDMKQVEQVIYSLLRRRLVEGYPSKEVVMFLNWCKEQTE